jgi:hypothetical protein
MSIFTQFARNPLLIVAMFAVIWSFFLPNKIDQAGMCLVAMLAALLNVMISVQRALEEIKSILQKKADVE